MAVSKICKLGRKGQMVLPKEVRDALGLKDGDSFVLVFQREGQALLITPERYAALTRGLLRGMWGKTKADIGRHLAQERDLRGTAND